MTRTAQALVGMTVSTVFLLTILSLAVAADVPKMTKQQLIEMGFADVYALKGGLHEWFRAKFPVVEK